MGTHLSIVTSLYKSEATVSEFVRRANDAARAITPSYEIILANDGSPDQSLKLAISLIKDYPQLRIVDLSRNFGQLNAIHAGLTEAQGDYVFVLDSDLEEPPELLGEFYSTLRSKDVDVVYGVQTERQDPFFRSLTSTLFYSTFQRMTGVSDLQNMLILRVMTRRFLNAYLSLGDYHLFVAGLSNYSGFDKLAVRVNKTYKGYSAYTFRRRLTMAGDAILSFSTYPLYFIFFASLLLAVAMALIALTVLIKKFTVTDYQAGWASLVVSIWFVGSIIINSLAVVGLYIAKIFEQVKQRPRFIVRKTYAAGDFS